MFLVMLLILILILILVLILGRSPFRFPSPDTRRLDEKPQKQPPLYLATYGLACTSGGSHSSMRFPSGSIAQPK